MQNDGRLRSLDILRGFAILLVLGRHLPVWPAARGLSGPMAWCLEQWRFVGWLGVDLFFVLSGFLVSGLIYREIRNTGTFRPFHFLVRRGFKIYPAFYICLLLSWAIYAAFGRPIEASTLLVETFFLQSYWLGLIGVTWSLAVEEHFYILLAVLFFALSRRKSDAPLRPLPLLLIGIAVAVLVYRVLSFDPERFEYLKYFANTHRRIDSLLCGVLLGYFAHYHADALRAVYQRFRWPLLLAVPALLWYPATHDMTNTPGIYTFGFTLSYLAFGILLLAVYYDIPSSFQNRALDLFTRAVAWIGFYSYSIYLWHEQLYFVFWRNAILKAIADVVGVAPAFHILSILLLIAAVLWGALMGRLIETPALRLRDRWFPSRAKPSSAT